MPIRVSVDPEQPAPEAIVQAVEALSRGRLVAFPTDTLYGLAVDPRNAVAVGRLYDAKGRSRDQAFPLVAADLAQVEAQAGTLGPLARRLADAFWPGPLTLVIPAHPALVPELHAGLGTVAVRVPAHAVARALAAQAGHPVTATSANRSGAPAPSTPGEVEAGLGDRVSLILDAGAAPGGPPSTIVDVSGGEPQLLRAGAIAWARVLEFMQ